MDFEATRQALKTDFNEPVESMISLGDYTSFGIGGPAALFTSVSTPESAAILFSVVHRLQLPHLVLGGGTNLLVSDDGFDGLAIHTRFDTLRVSVDDHTVSVGAAVPVSTLVSAVIDHSLAGLQFAAGLPGTVGGAVAGNAGCFGSCFGDVLQSALVLYPDGTLKQVDASFFQFEYRKTAVKRENVLVVEAYFQLHPGNQGRLRREAESHLELRRTKHPSKKVKTAGSYFKNLPPLEEGGRRRAAGSLLEAVGAKNEHVGDAAVFEKHANILINLQNATAKQMLTLEARLKRKVFEKFGVVLEPEVRFVGNRPVIDE